VRYFEKEEDNPIDREIDAVLTEMDKIGVMSEKYPVMIANLERLRTIKTQGRRLRISPDTMAIIAGNLVGILLIIAYEQKHVITTKGLNQLIRLK
jgi:hypothetical protein